MQYKTIMGWVCTNHAKPHLSAGLTAYPALLDNFLINISCLSNGGENGTVFAYLQLAIYGRETGSPAQMKEIINSFNNLKVNDAE